MASTATLRQEIQRLEAQRQAIDAALVKLRAAVEDLESEPDLDDLKELARSSKQSSNIPQRAATQYELIAAYLARTNNEPKSARELAEGSGANLASLAAVLYTTHKDLFVATPVKGFKRRFIWRLTPLALEVARQHLNDLAS